jgi:two-component system OmpR family sensor kinase
MRRFVGDASHELRTPLTSIRGFAELYRQGALPAQADVDRAMNRVESEAARMGLLVEDLLLLARLDQQRPLEHTPVDLLELATDAVQDARAVDPSRTVDLEVVATGPAPVVSGDAPRLRQVLGNLVGNALTHTTAPVTVRVSTATGHAVVEVEDRGPGIPVEDRPRVFERFFRADTSRTRASGGTGLGLSIVAALVAAHRGSVEVLDTPGGGATFRVTLPLAG